MVTVIVYGPERSGKTSNANALCQMYGCEGVNDGGPLKQGYLNLVNHIPARLNTTGYVIVSIYDALNNLHNKAGE